MNYHLELKTEENYWEVLCRDAYKAENAVSRFAQRPMVRSSSMCVCIRRWFTAEVDIAELGKENQRKH